MEIPEMPDNFSPNFSYGGGWDSKIDPTPGTGDKFSDVIMADDPITGEPVWSDLVGEVGQKGVVKNQILPENMEILRQRIASGLGPAEDSKWRDHPSFPPPAENILSFDEWKAMRADPSYDELENHRKWFIIVDSSHGDDSARHSDVVGVLLLVH